MTEQHVSILRRFADRIVLLFDADNAGDLAVNRAVELFLTQPVEILIASMPEGIDPDEFLLAHGAEGFQRMFADASDALTYKWRQLSREFQSSGDLTARQRAVSQYLELLAGARGTGPIDPLRWGAALSRVSRLIEIPAEELNRRFKVSRTARGAWEKKRSHGGAQQAGGPHVVERGENATDRAEICLLGVLLIDPSRWHDVQQRVQPQEFSDPARRELAGVYWNYQRDEGEPIFSEFLDLLQEGDLKTVAIRAVQDVQALQDRAAEEHGIKPEVTLGRVTAESLAHWSESRRRNEREKLVAELRRTSVAATTPTTSDGGEGVERRGGEEVDEVALLKQLQEQARRADLRRV
jgi:DNA primase